MATQQDVIKAFMRSLDNSTLSGANALDEAIRNCSNGKFSDMQNLIDCFIRDVGKYGGSYSYDVQTTNFLKNYCGIILDNTDTGAISGSDAGGTTTKTAQSIVPETGSAANVAHFPSGGRTTINGLTFIWPDRNTLTADEQAITDRIYTWWAKGALNLIQESYGLNFQESGTSVKEITVKFYSDSTDSALASVNHSYSLYTGKASKLTLNVNMYYYSGFNQQDVNGASNNYSAGYLDRTLAHEFVHAVMAANIDHFHNLPLFVKEGLAELIHGIDDERTSSIRQLASTSFVSELSQLFSIRGTYYNYGSHTYAGGYMLFRYLAKQAATETSTPIRLPAGVTYNANKTTVSILAPFTGTWDSKDYAATVRTIDASQDTNPITIKAGSYNNIIKAGKNGSNIYAQGGNDTIYGGNGKDVVWYGSGDGADTISGFQSGKDILRFYNKAQLGSVTTAGTTVTLKIGSGSVKLAGKTNQRVDITDTAGKNAIYYFGRQDKANTFVYGANQRYYGSTQYKDILQVNTGATVSLANTTLYHDIDTLDATRSKAAVKLTGGAKGTTLYGSALNDTLTAGSGGASLYGGKGNDTLYGGNGNDRFYWGTGLGNDVVFNYQSNKDIVTFTSGSLKSGRSSGGDVILTSSAGNTITLKNAANKTILVADTKGKLTRKLYLPTGITYNTNKTAVTIKAPYTGTWNAANFATTVRTVDASQNTKLITIKAGSYNNTIKAGKNGSNIYGQGGSDTIYGGNGKDVFWYGSGDGADTIYNFQSGKDILRFYNKAQLGSITTAGTTVTLKIGSGSVKFAGKTNQRVDITDAAGKNAIYYFGRQDKANTFVYGANQRYYGSAKYKDTLQVNTGATVSLANTALCHDIDALDATRSKAAVKLTGGTKAATLYGSALNDTLIAGSGGASLYGGKGNDTLYGGNGTDRFYWGAGLGNDTIYNYTSGKDLIIFSAGSLKSGKGSGQDVILTSNTGNTLTLKKAAGKTITIQGSNGKKITKTYSAPTTTSLPAGVTYNSQTMTVKLSTGIVTDFSLSGNDVILKSTIGNIRIATAKDKILSVIYGNGVKATYKVVDDIPTTSNIAYNNSRKEVVLGKKTPSTLTSIVLSGYSSQATTLNGTAYQSNYIYFVGSNKNDTLIAGNGHTSLFGGYGNDKLYGGNGKNIFYWSNYYGNDIIYNYTKGQDNISLFDGRIEGYTVSGNDVILKSGTATLTVKDIKPKDITVYTSSNIKDTYWYDKKLPVGVTCNNATNTFFLTNAYSAYSFKLSTYPTIAKNVDARKVMAPYGFTLSGDDRNNILYASNSGSSIFTGRGKDTIYFGKGKDTLYWYSYNDDKVVYNYTKGQDKIHFTGSYTYYTKGNDLVLKTTNSTLTLKNTKITDVTIGNIYNSAPLTTNKTSLNYQCDVLAVNTKQQASTASLMPITSQNHNDYLSMSQKLTLAQSGKNKLTV